MSFIIQVCLNDAAEKRPFTPSLDLLYQKAASLQNGRFLWLLGLSPARETMVALVAYPAGLKAGV